MFSHSPHYSKHYMSEFNGKPRISWTYAVINQSHHDFYIPWSTTNGMCFLQHRLWSLLITFLRHLNQRTLVSQPVACVKWICPFFQRLGLHQTPCFSQYISRSEKHCILLLQHICAHLFRNPATVTKFLHSFLTTLRNLRTVNNMPWRHNVHTFIWWMFTLKFPCIFPYLLIVYV